MNPPVSTSPTSPAEIVGELLSVVERLSEVLILETTTLKQTNARQSEDLTGLKTRLVVRYEMLLGACALVPKEQLSIVSGFERVVDSVSQLNLLATENATAIERHMKATKHLLEIIARAARKAAQPNFTYGKERLGYGVRGNKGAAVAVNRVF